MKFGSSGEIFLSRVDFSGICVFGCSVLVFVCLVKIGDSGCFWTLIFVVVCCFGCFELWIVVLEVVTRRNFR